jgi:hypothetical protein
MQTATAECAGQITAVECAGSSPRGSGTLVNNLSHQVIHHKRGNAAVEMVLEAASMLKVEIDPQTLNHKSHCDTINVEIDIGFIKSTVQRGKYNWYQNEVYALVKGTKTKSNSPISDRSE